MAGEKNEYQRYEERERDRVRGWVERFSPKDVMLLLNTIRYRFKSIYDLLEFRYLIYGKTYATVTALSLPHSRSLDLFFQRRRKCSNMVANSFTHTGSPWYIWWCVCIMDWGPTFSICCGLK